jgi:predicted RNase H-like nuclease (RuvC/YqgF family)
MRTRLAGLLVFLFLFAAPVFAREMMTTGEARVYEKPDKDSAVVATLQPNVKVDSDERKDFWFHVDVKIDGKAVSGWVYQTDIEDLMGRSKGQLLAENKRLFDELAALREKTKALDAELKESREKTKSLDAELKKSREEQAALQETLDRAERALRAAQDEIERLRAEIQKAKATGR